METKSAWFASFAMLVLTGTVSYAENLDTISRPDIAATNCPTEWANLVALQPGYWADTNPIEIDPSLDDVTTEAVNKYFLAIMALADHVSNILGFAEIDAHTQSYFDEAKAKYNLSTCLTPTQAERDIIVEAAKLGRTSATEDTIRVKLFEAFDQYECMAFAQVSAQILRLDPQSVTFPLDYEDIISTTLNECK
ncbi:MAG: hypothetical protein L3J37_09570 [Rhodobacteraceae bacterium]|nr:hypothetical protein [Paracoccaceae bacterium]